MLDLDNLKHINDTYGHINGDIAMKAAAGIILQILNSPVTVPCPPSPQQPAPRLLAGRLSGDEFAALLYGYSSREDLQRQIGLFYQQMLQTTVLFSDGSEYPIRLSCGYLFYQDYPNDYRQLLHLADQALYQSKRTGKGKFTAYLPDMEMPGKSK